MLYINNQTTKDKFKITLCSWLKDFCSFNKKQRKFNSSSEDYAVLFTLGYSLSLAGSQHHTDPWRSYIWVTMFRCVYVVRLKLCIKIIWIMMARCTARALIRVTCGAVCVRWWRRAVSLRCGEGTASTCWRSHQRQPSNSWPMNRYSCLLHSAHVDSDSACSCVCVCRLNSWWEAVKREDPWKFMRDSSLDHWLELRLKRSYTLWR